MSARLTWSIVGFGLLLLVVALVAPSLVGATTDDQQQTLDLETNDSYALTEYLTVTLDSTNTTSSPSTANVTVAQTKDLRQTTVQVNETEQVNSTVDGDGFDVTADSVESGSARLSVGYDALTGWNDGARTFMNQMDVILVLLSLVMMTAGIVWGVLG